MVPQVWDLFLNKSVFHRFPIMYYRTARLLFSTMLSRLYIHRLLVSRLDCLPGRPTLCHQVIRKKRLSMLSRMISLTSPIPCSHALHGIGRLILKTMSFVKTTLASQSPPTGFPIHQQIDSIFFTNTILNILLPQPASGFLILLKI